MLNVQGLRNVTDNKLQISCTRPTITISTCVIAPEHNLSIRLYSESQPITTLHILLS